MKTNVLFFLQLTIRTTLQRLITNRRSDKLDPATNRLRMQQSARRRVVPVVDQVRMGGHHYQLEPLDQEGDVIEEAIRHMRDVA